MAWRVTSPESTLKPRKTENMKQQRWKLGERAFCALCDQDIEWSGKHHGWTDRGGNRSCVPYEFKGEIVIPPKNAKHKPVKN